MRPSSSQIDLSATDLGRFLSCRHLTALDLAVARKLRPKPPAYPDPALEILKERGLEHEKAFVEKERATGKSVIEFDDTTPDRAAKTIAAMKDGIDIIYQGALAHDGWFGYADVLRRIDTPSPHLGQWSYEVIDTKLSRETKATTILQLVLYSEIVGVIQGTNPEHFFVVTPDEEERYRLADYDAYSRLVKHGLAATITKDPLALAAAHYPEPVEYCEVCRWEQECDRKRRADDHLSLVAGISRTQRHELEGRGVTTLTDLARMPLPLTFKPSRGAAASYERVREQARVQLEGREKKAWVHELLAIHEGEGLTRLPAPSKNDMFLDLEGDPFVGDGGHEYLFGLVTLDARGKPEYHEFWAFTPEEERAAFERVIDKMIAALDEDPKMHVYHYGGYEPGAMKRLMGRYATRETEVDRLLRGDHFVDLFTMVKQSLRASVESYSIKKLEPFYGFDREMDLKTAGDIRAVVERCLERGERHKITNDDRVIVAAYNRDDCVSTLRLRDWLEELRAGLVKDGTDVPRPKPKEEKEQEKLKEREARVAARVAQLIHDIPLERDQRSVEQHARWLLAHMLDYYRREDKVTWWEFFDMREKTPEELEEMRGVVTGLQWVERIAKARTRVTDRYRFPEKACRVRVGDKVHDSSGAFGEVSAIDLSAGTIDILKSGKRTDDHPPALFAHAYIDPSPKPEALERIAEAVIEHGIAGDGPHRAGRSLLMRETPRLKGAVFTPRSGENAGDFARRVVTHLEGSVLPVQGPPGTGKTFTGARMICELVHAGKRVGVTATGHAVIHNLLKAVVAQAKKENLTVCCGAKVHKESVVPGEITEYTDNDDAFDALTTGKVHVMGGTSWLWAREDAAHLVDVLVVDEAGQMTLADVVVASQAADSVVLLGDPQQLEQPQRGSHPDGTEASALSHILDGHKVITPDRGIFLGVTWRMAPAICAFCSEVFYENQLTTSNGLDKQRLTGTGEFDGAGLWIMPVEHVGNQHESQEEVEAVARVIEKLVRANAQWFDARDGAPKPMTTRDVLVVAAYNAQVDRLREALSPRGVRVGTVDKFQGQEAAVVIYSMAASSPSDASRGMEFLYSLNRLNVATSRARCATIVVASPRLFEPECKSPKQMKLANGLCRYVEMARVVSV